MHNINKNGFLTGFEVITELWLIIIIIPPNQKERGINEFNLLLDIEKEINESPHRDLLHKVLRRGVKSKKDLIRKNQNRLNILLKT